MILGRIGCLVGLHQPDRAKVEDTGYDYYAPCQHCGTRLVRRRHRVWVRAKAKS